MNQGVRGRIALLLVCAAGWWVARIGFSNQDSETAVDPNVYKAFLASQVSDIYDLQDFYLSQREDYIPILPPDPEFILTQPSCPEVIPFDPQAFPDDFVKGLVAEYENSVPVYPVILAEDFLSRDTLFLNAEGEEVYALPAVEDYDPYADLKWMHPEVLSEYASSAWLAWMESLYDPARIEIRVKLIAVDDVEPYLYAQAQVEAAAAELQFFSEEEGGGLLMMQYTEEWSNSLWIAIRGSAEGATNWPEITVHVPWGFTNLVEVYQFDASSNNWFNGMASAPWVLAVTGRVDAGTNVFLWADTNAYALESRFYAAGNGEQDTDEDGLADARELFMHHTDPSQPDTDGDGVSDGDEVAAGTNPLDKYSVPPPDMLSVSGSSIVDESGEAVTLKAVNIGGWLAFEQWMVGFEPKIFTNAFGITGSSNHMDEATLRESLSERVDCSVVRLARYNDGTNGGSLGSSWYGPSAVFSGSYSNGTWIRFTTNFSTGGVNRLSVIIARDGSAGNPQLQVKVGSTNVPPIGILKIADTGGWCDWSEQTVSLSTNISGTQTVYLVASSSSGDIGNVYRVRFYREDNTQQLLETFRQNYLTTNDLDNLKSLGYNCIRLPFLYNLLQDETGTNYLSNGWTRIDWVLDECQKRRMWCILDLHGTPGGQNYSDHNGLGEELRNRVWKSQVYKDRTSNLWAKIAERYSTNQTVAGYDLFNEPDPYRTTNTVVAYQTAYSNSILPLASTLYSAIRAKDTNHLVFMESNFMYTNMWNDIWSCPAPSSRGWANVVYEFHHYDHSGPWNDTYDVSFATQKEIADRIVKTYTRFMAEKQAPVLIGEFGSITAQNIDYFVRQFNANGIHWGQWNFRHFGYDDTRWPWSGWGLDYRIGGSSSSVNTNIQPNVKSDSFAVLSNKLAQYTRANYAAHPYLPEVVENTAKETNTASERTEFYLNTFDGPTRYNFNDANAWPWRKTVAVSGTTNQFIINDGRARFRVELGKTAIRLASRTEADARFETLDSTGCWFSVDVVRFDAASTVTGPEAEIRLVVSRDAVTNLIYSESAPSVVARLSYDQSVGSSNISLCLYSRTGSVSGTYGNLLCSNTMAFVTGMPLRLYMDATTALVAYNGVTNSGLHGQQTKWTGGAVCMVEAEDKASGGTVFAEVDNLKVWRPNAEYSSGYTNNMTDYPSGIYALAEPERLAIRRWNQSDDWVNSYMTNGTLYCIPERKANGWQCVNPRRDYQNDVRMNLTATNVVEIRAAYTNFSQGIAKICALPEYFPGEIKGEYAEQALYVEMVGSGGNIEFTAYRQNTGGTRTALASPVVRSFQQEQSVSLQLGADTLVVYYGTEAIISNAHGVTGLTNVYAQGVYPHYEFLNSSNTTTATVQMKGLRSRTCALFAEPSE